MAAKIIEKKSRGQQVCHARAVHPEQAYAAECVTRRGSARWAEESWGASRSVAMRAITSGFLGGRGGYVERRVRMKR